MNDQTRVVVSKICRSIDALTKEIHLLREDLNRRDRFEGCKEIKSEELEVDEMDKMPKVYPPVVYPGRVARSTGEGPLFPIALYFKHKIHI